MEEKRANSDRVIAYLQATGQLEPGQLSRARRLWRETGRKDRLWRVLLRTQELEESQIYEAAATAYGFQPVNVGMVETVGLVGHLAKQWPDTVIPRLVGMGIIPVVPAEGTPRNGVLTFAAFDPTRADVRRMVETVATGTHSIRYLSPANIRECVRVLSDFLPDIMPASFHSIGSKSSKTTTVRKAA